MGCVQAPFVSNIYRSNRKITDPQVEMSLGLSGSLHLEVGISQLLCKEAYEEQLNNEKWLKTICVKWDLQSKQEIKFTMTQVEMSQNTLEQIILF